MEGNKDHAHLSSPLVQLRKVCTTLFTLVKKKKKTKFLFEYHLCYSVTVATTCNGKRNNLTAKGITSRQKKKTHGKRKDSQRKEEPHDKKEKKHGKKGKTHGKRKNLMTKGKDSRKKKKPHG